MFLVGGAIVFNWLMATEGVPAAVSSWLAATVSSPWSFLLLMNTFLMIFGMPMESFAMILLLSPIFLDASVKYGLNPNDASDSTKDLNGDGYTNIEKFIFGLDPAKNVNWKDPKNNIDPLGAAKSS